MKNTIYITLLGLILSFSVVGQNVHYELKNLKIIEENNTSLYEFDVFAKSGNSEEFRLHSGQLYFNYDVAVFGENVVESNQLTAGISSDELLLAESSTNVKLFKDLVINDNTESRFSISWTVNFNCFSTEEKGKITEDSLLLVTIQLEIPSDLEDSEIDWPSLVCFEQEDIFTNQTFTCPGDAENQITNDFFTCLSCFDADEDGVCDDIDNKAPTSAMNPIVSETKADSIVLSWTGEDNEDGSGIETYELFVSTNEGEFISVVSTSDSSYTFEGTFVNTYSFYVIATDSVGNVEEKVEAEVSVTFINPAEIEVAEFAKNTFCGLDTVNLNWTSEEVDSISIVAFDTVSGINLPIALVKSSNGEYQWDIAGHFSSVAYLKLILKDYHSIATDTSNLLTIYPTFSTTENVDVCAGSSFQFADGTSIADLQKDTVYTSIFASVSECDSFITTSIHVIQIDTSVTIDLPNLISNEVSLSADYQWINCATNEAIPQEVNREFTASASGAYAVEITKNECKDTSSCKEVIILGGNSIATSVSIFPNPFADEVQIDLGKDQNEVMVEIVSSIGKVVFRKEFKNQQLIRLDLNIADGAYLMNIRTGNEVKTIPVSRIGN